VLELEGKLARAQAKVEALERRAAELKDEVARLMERRDQLRAEIVPYQQGGTDLVRCKDLETLRLRVKRGA
jgi:MerR family transcriptional regulator/heat shock protein HspR